MDKNLEEFEKILGFQFKNKDLLKTALTHRSYKISHKQEKLEDNERLEFLGDSVLNLCISMLIFQKFPEDKEGELTKKRAYLVCKNTLIKIAKKLNLLDYIFLGKRERRLDMKSKSNISARALEAVIGAMFLDAGLEPTCERIKKWFRSYLGRFPKTPPHDYKTQLQELCQKEFNQRPEYEVISVSGPSHEPKFEIAIKLNGEIITKAKGTSKKEAEILAAKKALNILKKKLAES